MAEKYASGTFTVVVKITAHADPYGHGMTLRQMEAEIRGELKKLNQDSIIEIGKVVSITNTDVEHTNG